MPKTVLYYKAVGAISSVVELLPYKQAVTGSSPVSPIVHLTDQALWLNHRAFCIFLHLSEHFHLFIPPRPGWGTHGFP